MIQQQSLQEDAKKKKKKYWWRYSEDSGKDTRQWFKYKAQLEQACKSKTRPVRQSQPNSVGHQRNADVYPYFRAHLVFVWLVLLF